MYSVALQNGEQILSEYFGDITRKEYEDSLEITDTQDLVDWIKSTISIAGCSETDLEGLYDFFEERYKKNGTIRIPKEAGLFISRE